MRLTGFLPAGSMCASFTSCAAISPPTIVLLACAAVCSMQEAASGKLDNGFVLWPESARKS
jgi:hypothetical protein